MIVNPSLLFVGFLLVAQGFYGLYLELWGAGLMSLFVGIANCVLSTVRV